MSRILRKKSTIRASRKARSHKKVLSLIEMFNHTNGFAEKSRRKNELRKTPSSHFDITKTIYKNLLRIECQRQFLENEASHFALLDTMILNREILREFLFGEFAIIFSNIS